MAFDAIWPFFGCLCILLLLAASPLCRAADDAGGARRVATLDGLRGFLALAVVFHHVMIYHRWLIDGVWAVPAAPFYAALGPVGVSLFFMTTGFLFWSQLIRARGRPDWVHLYVGRIFRIGPLYLVAFAAVSVIGLAEHHWRLAPGVGGAVGSWLTLGLLAPSPLDGDPGWGVLLAYVIWTLHWEWIFYLCLPLLALATLRRGAHLAVAAVGLLIMVALSSGNSLAVDVSPDLPLFVPTLFLVGMVCGSLHAMDLRARLPPMVGDTLVVLALSAAVLTADNYLPGSILLLGAAFYLLVSGCTLWGLLLSRAARRLGNISYGLYLLQGLALAAMLQPRPLRTLAADSAIWFWGLSLGAAVLLVAGCTGLHAVVERPGIWLGRRIARAMRLGTKRLAPIA